jgi:hypothetical protein
VDTACPCQRQRLWDPDNAGDHEPRRAIDAPTDA